MGQSKFAVGEIVRLKSGGPRMTVELIRKEGGAVRALWFGEGSVRNEGWFPDETLIPMNYESGRIEAFNKRPDSHDLDEEIPF
jgi:uncharacterized protein YodC (DUF2158 family)